MNANFLRKIARGQPFKPFDLRMNDGRAFDVRHPEFIGVNDRVVTLYSERNGTTLYLEPALIASVEFTGSM